MFKSLREVKFDRNELAGSVGDIGTDLPLLIGMILAIGLHAPSVLIMFGAMQIFTGFFYRMPMPVQPLKAMAAIVIAQGATGKITPKILYGAGLAIGITIFLLTVTHLIDWIAKVIPKCVIRGIQFGLGLKLALLVAIKKYIWADGVNGLWLAIIAFLIIIFFIGNRKYPAALFVILLGLVYALIFNHDKIELVSSVGFNLPKFNLPIWADILTGFVLLAIPQIPLSIGNSILATRQLTEDYFPAKAVSVHKISFTYSFINMISPFFSGIPVCHGSGGMAGHYTFGGRTGGSVIIYGSLFLFLGFFLGNGFDSIIHIFPLPVLGVILIFEGLALMMMIRDVSESKSDLTVALLVGLISGGIPYGFVIGLIVGTVLYYLIKAKIINGFTEK
ncbi:MAG: transporter [Planctomycetes bacterium]|nr:transporter [Planctomycetota bacterium]